MWRQPEPSLYSNARYFQSVPSIPVPKQVSFSSLDQSSVLSIVDQSLLIKFSNTFVVEFEW